ncbi:class I SAM-dependent methyltransferase [Ornithinibacillus salinisoli]|uniref:Class I SAM-dependent methyltransferase n=1 Tax=Ornithinibacillus salinisoli TaxID=1848459 RepID=A0ABW4VW01_9BACI
MKKEKKIKKYNKQVKMYERNRDNRVLDAWRNKLIQSANGKVLEVGVGVGANFRYYNKESVFLTCVDFSSEMIKSATQAAEYFKIDADFIQEDIETLSMEPNSFDCIVSTLSLCSYSDPVAALNKFNEWCRNDGTILLMEHGLSSNSLLSFTQKLIDPLYLKISGCHCNRDIQKIIEESKLQIHFSESYRSDILSLIWAKPCKV